ncbi:hypothetical protein FRC11_010443 [Ceratobasidium sp. 423]|nr:hypothetical protein FRC11_010443 [Ceratobasidium sp. 423]
MARVTVHVVQASPVKPSARREVSWFSRWFMDTTPLSPESAPLAGVPANIALPGADYGGQPGTSILGVLQGLHQETV